jgi:hypothetical protein
MSREEWDQGRDKLFIGRDLLIGLWFHNKFGNQARCAEALVIPSSTVSDAVKRLVEQGILPPSTRKTRSDKNIRISDKPVEKPQKNSDDNYVNLEKLLRAEATIAEQEKYIHTLESTLDSKITDDTTTHESITVRHAEVPSTEHLQNIDFDWHPGVAVGSEARNDVNRILGLIDSIHAIQERYAFTGKWGPNEWSSILGGLQAIEAVASAQRRFRPAAK